MLGETINKHMDKYLKAVKAFESLWKRVLRNDDLIFLIIGLMQPKTMNAIEEQR